MRVLGLVALFGAFTAGVVYLFGVQFAAGDLYPEYSSLRSDPVGTKLLHDSLAALPGLTVSRNYLPLETLREGGSTVLVLALEANDFAGDVQAIHRLDDLARRGNRVVAALAAGAELKPGRSYELHRAWHVRLAVDAARNRVHKLYFAEAPEWHVLDRVGDKILGIERDFGKGSIVLFAESDHFTNESTAAADRLEMVSAALGSYSRIVFDEQHLGIAESGSIVGLARRFHLGGMAMGLAVCAMLFLWRSASAFPPAAVHEPARLSGRTSHSGLLTLLRRHIPPDRLAAACWQEWLAVNRRAVPADRLRQAAGVVRASADPLLAARELQGILKGKA